MAKEKQMLNSLLDFEGTPTKEVYMPRLGNKFIVEPIDGKVINRIQEQCTFVDKKKNKHIDEQRMGSLMILRGVSNVDFSDQRLLEKHGVSTPEECVQKALYAGEIARLSDAILDVSGFNYEEDEVKN